MNCFYVKTFASKRFEASQFLIHHFTRHLIDEWRWAITFQRVPPVINRIYIRTLVLDIVSPAPSLSLIQLVFRDFHDLP